MGYNITLNMGKYAIKITKYGNKKKVFKFIKIIINNEYYLLLLNWIKYDQF